MEQNIKRCAVFGQNTICFDWGFDEDDEYCGRMKDMLLQELVALRQQGVMDFLVACDHGVGLYAAEIVRALRADDQTLRLHCVLPHEEQATKWTPQLRDRYFAMLGSCTSMDCIAPHEQPDAQFTAFRRIIEQSNLVLAVYEANDISRDTKDKLLAYALELDRPLMLIHPRTGSAQWVDRG